MSDTFQILSKMNDKGFHHIQINEGEYKGTVFTLGGVWFEEDNKLSFEYDIVEGKIEEGDEVFGKLLGDYIMEMLLEQLRKDQA